MSKKRKEIEVIRINQEDILPGENSIVQVRVGRLPSGTRINMPINVFRSEKPGPTVLLLAGVHGDEINGVEIIRRFLYHDTFSNLKSGTIIAIPIVNIFGFINYSRDVPDGKDVNRSFPGALRGSLASRVARIITVKILPHVDYIIDLHTGGHSRYNFPQLRLTKNDERAMEIAKIFGAPFIIKKSVIPKSLRKTANEKKIPTLVYEGGESLRYDGLAINTAINGIKRVLNYFGILEEKVFDHHGGKIFKKTSWIRASASGLFIWSKSSGHAITKGEPLGILCDPQGTKKVYVLAKRDGFIIGHNNASVVNQGDALFHVAYDYEEYI